MQNYKIYVILNTSFWKNNENKMEGFSKTTAFTFMKMAYPSMSANDYCLSVFKTCLVSYSDSYSLIYMKKLYMKNQQDFETQILLFQSIYDIHPKIKKAVRFIDELHKIGYKVYILSLNPEKPFSDYREDYLNYNGIRDVIDRRYRHEKYNKCLLNFAVDLRRGDPVTYKTITQYTGIPKSTLISYMKREGIELNPLAGRNKLTDEEEETLIYLYENGCIYS